MFIHSVGKHRGALWFCILFSHNQNNMVQSLQNLFQINVTSSIGTVLQITLQRENFLFSLRRQQKAAYRTSK